ncbi:hypothetical protein T11_2391 [Trichinella zimbabwensis]|uniref:Uncharacterized protein n=1 Tax=Trichinella zimbabwensis TaxID=268475 RepID=A0A0V1I9X3_9BILA|nr:hypothetical protein T11_2391 [Trichinella zimbabwensis]
MLKKTLHGEEKIDYLRFTTIWKSPVTQPNTYIRRERAKLQGLTMDQVDRAIVKGKVALRTGSGFTAAPVPQFQMLAPDWSTSPDMSGHVQTSAFMLAQPNTA